MGVADRSQSWPSCRGLGLIHVCKQRDCQLVLMVSDNGVIDLVPAVQQAWAGARGAGGPLL